MGKNQNIKIVLADDHPLMRQALRMWIEKQRDLEIIAEANDGKEAVEIAGKLKPDVIIMDISMPKLNGLEATKRIKLSSPSTEILVLTVHTDDEHIASMIKAGAGGYIIKTASGEEIIHAIRALAYGECLLPSNISRDIMSDILSNSIPVPINLNKLDKREITILRLVAKGFSNKQIALELGLSLRNVKAILTNVFLKLEVSSRTQAIAYGLKTNIIELKDLNK